MCALAVVTSGVSVDLALSRVGTPVPTKPSHRVVVVAATHRGHSAPTLRPAAE